jgi:hypothetical protein
MFSVRASDEDARATIEETAVLAVAIAIAVVGDGLCEHYSDYSACPEINIQVLSSSPPSTPPTHAPSSERLSTSEKSARDGRLILIDWDDTLCTSTLMASLGYRIDEQTPLPDELVSELADMQTAVIAMLEQAVRHGTVVIVTNAETGWVELSGERFVPEVAAAIVRLQIRVISARSTYEALCGANPSDWKTACFMQQVEDAQHALGAGDGAAAGMVDLLSIGDSYHEREAAHHVSFIAAKRRRGEAESAHSGAAPARAGTVKTVKLMERPDMSMLRRQCSLLAENMENICMHPESVDVNLIVDDDVPLDEE